MLAFPTRLITRQPHPCHYHSLETTRKERSQWKTTFLGFWKSTEVEACEDLFHFLQTHPTFFKEVDVSQTVVRDTMNLCLLHDRMNFFLTLIREAPELIARKDSHGDLLLHCYCDYHSSKFYSHDLLELLENRAPTSSVSIPDHTGRLPLQMVIEAGDAKSAYYLLDCYDKLNIPIDVTVPWTALCWRHNMPDDICTKTSDLVHEFWKNQSHASLKIVTKKFPDCLSIPDYKRRVPLQVAIESAGELELARFLIQRHCELGVRIDPTTPWIALCCRNGMSLNACSGIFALVPGNASVEDKDGCLALQHLCDYRGESSLSLQLFERVLQDYPNAAAIPNKSGSLPIHNINARSEQTLGRSTLLLKVYPEG